MQRLFGYLGKNGFGELKFDKKENIITGNVGDAYVSIIRTRVGYRVDANDGDGIVHFKFATRIDVLHYLQEMSGEPLSAGASGSINWIAAIALGFVAGLVTSYVNRGGSKIAGEIRCLGSNVEFARDGIVKEIQGLSSNVERLRETLSYKLGRTSFPR